MNKIIKASELIAEVKKLGEEFPDRKAGCTYFEEDGTPCCIVGHGLYRLGVREGVTEGNTVGSLTVIDFDVAQDELDWLIAAQDRQDSGATWGEAVRAVY